MSKTKYQQIFRFLKEFYQLRETTVKDITTSKKYLSCLWLDDFSKVSGARYRLLGHDMDDEPLLLTLKRPKRPVEPERPTCKEKWRPWINRYLDQLDSAPELQEVIEKGDETLNLKDLPELELELLNYMRELSHWREAQTAFNTLLVKYQTEKKVYDQLFDAATKLESFNERYELLLGVGLFCRRTSPTIQRPVVTIPLEMEITDTGVIRVSLSAATKLFQIENDFMASLEGFSATTATRALEERLKNDSLDFWEMYEDLQIQGFRTFVSKMGSEVDYFLEETRPDRLPKNPSIYHSPVLIFRERSVRSFTVLFESILKHLEEQEEESQVGLLDRIVYKLDRLPSNRNPQSRAWQVATDEILLPKESNKEQLEIARRIGRRDVVLVQGPPGTGKSHTIANIITYLLSRGKKVLVTAQTDQALKALRQHLPDAFLDLVIYFLQGADRKGNDLGKSVRKLQDSINAYQSARIQHAIDRNQTALQQFREERARLINDVKSLQQADKRLTELNSLYRNATLLELTDRVKQDENRYSWLKDEIKNLSDALAQLENLLSWYNLWREIEASEFAPYQQIIPDLKLLPDPAEVKDLQEKKRLFRQKYEINALLPTTTIPPATFKNIVDNFIALKGKLTPHQPWQSEMQAAFETNQLSPWKSLNNRTQDLLLELETETIDKITRNYDFYIPESVSPRQFKSDVWAVLEYVNTGKKLTGVLARLSIPQSVKSRRYIYKECRINNQLCNQTQELEILYHYARVQLTLTELDALWEKNAVSATDWRRKYEGYQMQLNQLQAQLDDYPTYIALRKKLSALFQCSTSFFEEPEKLMRLRTAVEAHALDEAIQTLEKKKVKGDEYLQSLSTKDIRLAAIREALRELDAIGYEQMYIKFCSLTELARKYDDMMEKQETLSSSFPYTMQYLLSEKAGIDLQRQDLEEAIYWADARYQLKQRFSESIDEKYQRLKRNDEDYRETALRFLKARATKEFIENLDNSDELHRKLTRWTQAVSKTGGKGKLAFHYRRKAQEILQQISQDIPCWIMPMYRLVDTLGPRPETFDVVIVDEASQLGPEALFLKYITKKIIVVGDDQQTAPESVGINIDQVNNLIRTHLSGIPDQEFYNTKHSFFEHVDAIAGGRIALREHFRCMPEIIEFSNQLCYWPNGIKLVPLKQYASNRLKPLEKYFVRDGTYTNDRNIPEVRAIVGAIKCLLKEDAYQDKTFGVIVLQGKHQCVEIDRQLRDELSPQDFIERKIVVGTPPDFQGDERDVIFLSLVTAHGHRRTSLTKDNFRRRYNVAMSRAREQVWLFHSVQEQDLKPNDLRFKLLHYFNTQKIAEKPDLIQIPDDRSQKPPKPFDSWFEVDIYEEIGRRGYVVEPQFKVGPYRIDLVVHLPNGKKIAVECDGDPYHEGEDLQRDIDRQLILERAKWEFFRVRWSHYKYSPEESLAKLWVLLEKKSEQGQRANIHKYPADYSKEKTVVVDDHNIVTPLVENPPKENQRFFTNGRSEEIDVLPPTQSGNIIHSLVDLLVFTNRARVYRQTRLIEIEAKDSNISNQFQAGEEEIYRVVASDYSGFMIFGYKNGKVDRVKLASFRASRAILQNAYHKEQKLLFIQYFREETDLACITYKNKVVVFSTDLVSEHSSRGNQGNQVLKAGSRVEKYILLSETKLADPDYYRRTTTNSKGYYLKEGDRV